MNSKKAVAEWEARMVRTVAHIDMLDMCEALTGIGRVIRHWLQCAGIDCDDLEAVQFAVHMFDD